MGGSVIRFGAGRVMSHTLMAAERLPRASSDKGGPAAGESSAAAIGLRDLQRPSPPWLQYLPAGSGRQLRLKTAPAEGANSIRMILSLSAFRVPFCIYEETGAVLVRHLL
jgi:hypothetical protein